jgi:5-hydroxyisourate hydrolase-like protein (transthyretin family)
MSMKMWGIKRMVSAALVLGLVVGVQGCGGGGGDPGTPVLSSGGGSSSAASAVLTLTASSTTVSSASPAQITAVLKDVQGNPVVGQVVTFKAVRSVAATGVTTALTNANGEATTTVTPASSTSTGADEVTASVTYAGKFLDKKVAFQFTTPKSGVLTLTASSSTATSASPAQITAVLRDGDGNPVAGQVVTFKVVRSLAATGTATALTNANGEASTTVSPASSTIKGADEVTASVTYGGKLLEETVAFQFNATNSGVLTLTSSSSTVSSASPAQITAVLRDANGNPVPGQVVTFKAGRSLAATGVATALTNASGEASTTVSPSSTAGSGADEVTASVTYAGTLLEKTTAFQINAAGSGVLTLTASSTTVSLASPAQITAVLRDSNGSPVAGQVVTFKVVRSLAVTGVSTALTNASGEASTTVTPASYTSKGADEVTASVTYGGKVLEKTVGFQFNATDITLAFGALSGGFTLSAYGQTSLVLNAGGASAASPVNVTLTSACVALGKGTISPSTATMISGSLTVQYLDNGCGAVRASDIVQASMPASSSTASATVPLNPPDVSSIGFVSASPEQIYLKGSGLGESSLVTFVVRDSAGNALQNRDVSLSLLTGAGGVTMEDRAVGDAGVVRTSDAQGRVSVRINSGTVPTPVRVQASLPVVIAGVTTTVSTVSSNLSVSVGLPSQLNFSLSQRTRNIEGYNIDGTTNTYTIIAADRSGNPVPAGTTINFRAEGGQVVATAQTQLVDGIARASVNFVSAQPKPADGRVTVTAYALGEESFEDLNGNNTYDSGEPFQDLGNIFFDRRFNGAYEAGEDEFLSLGINSSTTCVTPPNTRLTLGVDIPSRPGTCDGGWSGAGKVYVRRATETVLSTSAARPLWASTGGSSGTRGLSASCSTVALQPGSDPGVTQNYAVAGQTWYTGSNASDSIALIVADANGTRLNPMAAGTTIAASTTTTGLTVTLAGGSPVPSTSEASLAGLSFNFEAGTTSGLITVTFTSPSGTTSSVAIPVENANRPTICQP